MNQSQIYTLARQADLPDARAKVAAAVAMAESGGNPNAHNSTPPDDSYGLWQINMLGSLGPSRRALYQLKANTDLFDPATNARVMSAISKQGQDFSPWTTYTSGRYKQYMQAGVSIVDLAGAVGAAGPLGSAVAGVAGLAEQGSQLVPASVVDAAARFSDGLTRTARWISSQKNWLRVGYVVGGGALVLGAVSIVARPYATRAAGTVAGAVAPVGKVARAARKVAS